jgi:hypothetical protein
MEDAAEFVKIERRSLHEKARDVFSKPSQLRRRGVGTKSAQRCFSRPVFGEHVFVQVSAEDAPELWKCRRCHPRQRCSSG